VKLSCRKPTNQLRAPEERVEST